jgi:17beta-estradiol 17-dehydrogenase / very-long-chain 3-oxoacyl-CoA reductase
MILSSFKDQRVHALFEYVGVLFLGYTLLKTSLRIFNNVGTFFLGIGSLNLKKYGSWAVVTGCTDGIGKAYAENLAKKGLNIVLISRTLEKLQEQAKSIKEKYKVETKVISADFTGKFYYYNIKCKHPR